LQIKITAYPRKDVYVSREVFFTVYRLLRLRLLNSPNAIAPTANPRRIPSTGKPGIPTPPDGGLKTVELTVVTEVVVDNVVELLVKDVTVVDVDVSVELTVVVAVAV